MMKKTLWHITVFIFLCTLCSIFSSCQKIEDDLDDKKYKDPTTGREYNGDLFLVTDNIPAELPEKIAIPIVVRSLTNTEFKPRNILIWIDREKRKIVLYVEKGDKIGDGEYCSKIGVETKSTARSNISLQFKVEAGKVSKGQMVNQIALYHILELKGNGTEKEPIIIDSYDALKKFNQALELDVNLGEGLYFNQTQNIFMAQINPLEPTGMMPIGGNNPANRGFRGTYSGLYNNTISIISGLQKTSNISEECNGLFYSLNEGAVVKDLIINNTTLQLDNTKMVGVLAGAADGAIIHNVIINNGSIYGSSATDGAVGGVVGRAKNTKFSNINVSGINIGSEVSYNVGAIAGSVEVTDNTSYVNLSSDCASVIGINNVGGLFGYLKSKSLKLDSLNNTCTKIHGSGENIGGFIGAAYGDFELTSGSNALYFSDNNTFVTIKGARNAGGLIGYLEATDKCKIYDCIFSGRISNETTKIGTDFGGLIGRYNSSQSGELTIMKSTTSVYAAISPLAMGVGGFIGGVKGNLIITSPTDSLAKNEESNNMPIMPVVGTSEVGGLIGDVEMSSNVKIINMKQTASVSGHSSVGGLIGQSSGRVTISMSKVDGNATITSSGYHCGGLIGKAFKTVLIESNDQNFSFFDGFINSADELKCDGSGGVIGYALIDTLSMTNVRVNGTVTGNQKIGGFIGVLGNVSNNASIKFNGCIAGNIGGGDILGKSEVGGMIGFVNLGNGDFSMKNCENHKTIEIDNSGSGPVGGLIGVFKHDGTIPQNNTPTVGALYSCYNRGKILGESSKYTGGVIGIVTKFNTDNYFSFNYIYNYGEVTGSDITGGVIGVIGDNENNFADLLRKNDFRGTLDQLHNYGAVTAKASKDGASYTFCGGVIGYGASGSYDHGINNGSVDIQYCSNSGKITTDGIKNTGGIIGKLGYEDSYRRISIIRSYNIGEISFSGKYGGGIAGACGSMYETSTHGIFDCYSMTSSSKKLCAVMGWAAPSVKAERIYHFGTHCEQFNHGSAVSCNAVYVIKKMVDDNGGFKLLNPGEEKVTTNYQLFDFKNIWKENSTRPTLRNNEEPEPLLPVIYP